MIPEREGEGGVATILGLAEDITQRRRVAEELTTHRERLQTLVEERTKELQSTRRQVRFADRMSSIGTLAAGLGHDMNNVLLPVRAHLNAALAAAAPPCEPKVRECVRQVRTSIEYLQRLADGLHFLSMDPEREHGAIPGLHPETNLRAWWAQTGALLSKPVPKHARVIASFPARVRDPHHPGRTLPFPHVGIAPHQLTQVMLNLIINAGQAIPPHSTPSSVSSLSGLIRVSARLLPARSSGTTHRAVRVCVRDNGIGMSDDVKRHAFDMFFTTKPRGLGTGLGLPLVARLVHDAGGRVQIASTPGKGTSVWVDLPIAASRCPKGASSARRSPSP